SQGHRNSGWTCLSIDMVNHMVGAADTYGSAMGLGAATNQGYEGTGKPYQMPYPCPDGLMVCGAWVYDHLPYPLHEPRPPQRLDLHDMFPTSIYNAFTIMSPNWFDLLEQFKIPYRPEIMINFGSNSIMTMGNAEAVTNNFLMKFDFIFSFQLYITEFEDAVGDIVLPDACYLERYTPAVSFPSTFSHPQGEDDWGWTYRQPAVEPLFERRDFNEVMAEIMDKLGLLDKYLVGLTETVPIRYGGEMSEEKKFEHLKLESQDDKGYRKLWTDITHNLLSDRFGEEHGLEYFKKRGLFTWPKKKEDVYWKWFVPVRVPIYFEYFVDGGDKIQAMCEQFDAPDFMPWKEFFQPLAEWFPCPTHDENLPPEYDMYTFYWRAIMHCNSLTQQNPWLDELSQEDPYVYALQVHRDTAAQKGLKEGEAVWLENPEGHRVKVWLALTDCIEPHHVAVAAVAGHWTEYQPIAKDKGTFFNDLVEMDAAHTDPLTMGQDICCRVKMYKAE
ncbi:MAG: molybdopterin-binding protein, partial [Deltaproteobacteria bacterium]|nr:molybdopterin-binding protein [Deltaproteobacteria bacterium]